MQYLPPLFFFHHLAGILRAQVEAKDEDSDHKDQASGPGTIGVEVTNLAASNSLPLWLQAWCLSQNGYGS